MSLIRICILSCVLLGSVSLFASRTDSFNLAHTELHLKVRNFSARQLSGWVRLSAVLKVNTNYLRFDLKQLKVDSVGDGSLSLAHQRIGESIVVQLNASALTGDTVHVDIFYSGTPAADPSGWGGFYFSGDYAFNLGVGFAVYPHTFGRAWMPCVDEFTMKSPYEMYIETDSNYVAACNGVLLESYRQGDAMIWHYLESVPLSVYLASVSVSKFSILKSSYQGLQTSFPLELFYKASDSLRVKGAFVNLPDAIRFFEEAFGPQPYSKVGYNLVPFSSGAMEHAGNITYPNVFADGTSNYEKLMAHELSHHWWGNLVTCSNAGDMWLNEGWASYCEHFFTEKLRGAGAYKTSILDNHLYVLRYAHIIDGQVFSLTNIPETHTYGTHVYKKGADVVHSLRGVLGDSVFLDLCRKYQQAYRLKNASSIDMRNFFRDNGGAEIAESFFNHFVLDIGFPHVILSKQVHSGNGPYYLKVFTEQRPRFKTSPYEDLPIDIRFYKDRHTFIDKQLIVNHVVDSFEFKLPFKPVFVCLDFNEKISDAITDRHLLAGKSGTFDLPETFCKLIVNRASDSSLIRVEHHWVGPEKFVIGYPKMSNYRYITLDGVWGDSLNMDMEMTYDGRQGSTSGNTGYLDHTLIFKTEDSLTVLYRAFPGDYWREWTDIQPIMGNKNDKFGRLVLKQVKKGDYVLAMRDKNLGINSYNLDPYFGIKPNPGMDFCTIYKLNAFNEVALIDVYDLSGKLVLSTQLNADLSQVDLDVRDWAAGQYVVSISSASYKTNLKLIIQ